jgi:hypothetical protein
MKVSKRTVVALIGATLAAASLPATAQNAQCNSGENAVMCWARFAVESTTVGRPPVDSEYLLSLASLAAWDAILAIEEPGTYEPYASSLDVVRPASSDAAVATAAFEVLRIRVPAQASVLQDKYGTFMAAVADGPAKTNGIAVGLSAAQAVLAARAADNFNSVVPFVQPPVGPGVFEPTLPSTPVSLVLATVQPLGNRNIGDFRAPPPPSLTSKEYRDDFNEVKALGRATGSTRTPLQTETALFWSEKADIQYERALRTLAQAKSLDSFETARLNGMVHGCVADASLEGFHTKYYYMFWRPFHSVPRADTDGNPETGSDPGWTPFLNVNHPEYPSAHAFFTTALATALKKYFSTEHLNWQISSTATGTTRVYTDLDDLVSELQNARIYAGLHYRFSTKAGTKLGKQVCRNFLADHLRRVDDDDQDDEN